MLDTTIYIEILGNEVEVEVEYDIFGEDRPATLVDPAEYAEIEISSVSRVIGGASVDMTAMFSSDDMTSIEETLHESLCEDY